MASVAEYNGHHVGDIVRIKDWNDMADEYGYLGGSINVPFEFTQYMRQLCGGTMKITDIDPEYGERVRFLLEPTQEFAKVKPSFNFDYDYLYSEEMFQSVMPPRDPESEGYGVGEIMLSNKDIEGVL